MDDVKRSAREAVDGAKKEWRRSDGEDLGDKVANLGDDVRRTAANAADDVRHASDDAKHDVAHGMDEPAVVSPQRLPR